MDLVQILVVLIIIGVVLWLVKTYIPLDPAIRIVITAVVVILVCLWLLYLFGIGSYYIGPRR